MGSVVAFVAAGGSMRLAIAGDADARFVCGDACADAVVFA